jgi:VanZ family protein
VACLAYLALLTVMLVMRDPEATLVHRSGLLELYRLLKPWMHLLTFFVLGLLAFTSRWPVRWWGVAVVLILYAVATEAVQWFVPSRTVDPWDLAQNLAGLAAGALVAGIVRRIAPSRDAPAG